MAKIPLGSFDQPRVTPQALRSQVDLSGTLAAGRAIEQVGQTIQQTGGYVADTITRGAAQDKAERDALARVDAVNASTDYELEVAAAQQQFGEDLAASRVDFRTAGDAWGERLAKIQAPQAPAGADEVMRAQFDAALHQTQARARLKIDGLAATAQKAHFESAAVEALNKNIMVAGMPGANTAEAIARNQALVPLLQAAGYDAAKTAEMVHKADQAIYTNEAKASIDAAGADPGALRTVLQSLTAAEGRYTTVLTNPDNRRVLANSVRTKIAQVEAATQQAADKREAAAKGVVSDVWAQATSGILPTPDMLTNWQAAVAGTSQADAFRQAIGALQQVQGELRKSPAEQAAYVQGLRANLAATGGTPEDAARIDKVESVIAASNTQRQDAPLLWLASVTGQAAQPLDLQAALQQGNFSQLGPALQERMAHLTALRGQYGPSVKVRPLLPQEAAGLAQIVQSLPPAKLMPLFGAMRQATGSADTYNAVMQQIAPDAPLKAYAGEIAARPGGSQAASLMLRGADLLKGKDGASKFPMPPPSQFQAAFLDSVGNAYQGRGDALKRDLDAARAVYAASIAEDGKTQAAEDLDTDLFGKAIKAVVGEFAEFGDTRVPAPWGVSAEVFEDRAETLVARALAAAGLSEDADVGLMATPLPGRYILVQGIHPVFNPNVTLRDGRPMPVYIDWTPAAGPQALRLQTPQVDTEAVIDATLGGTR